MNFQSSVLTLVAAAMLVTPLSAQNQDLGDPLAEGGQVETTGTEASEADDEGGLTFTVTDENDWQDLGVAIPAFATDQDRPTPANAQGTAALGR
ncbi:MAG: Tol-Pal system protein TolB, partial [Pseudomonadota bacterium]